MPTHPTEAFAPELVEAEEYYQLLLKELPKAKERIVVAAMFILWGPKFAPLFEELKKAVERGVRVSVFIDVHTKLIVLHGLKPAKERRERIAKTFRLLEELAAMGAHVYYFGKLGIQPFRGRSHVKITVIDDTAYTFGGFNLFDESLATADFMLKSHDQALCTYLEKLVHTIGTTEPPVASREHRLDPQNILLFDGGTPNHSLIYDRACELAEQSKRVYYVSQWVPSSRLAFALKKTDASLYFNPPQIMPVPSQWGQAFDQQKYRLINSYQHTRYIHAKFMLFEFADGKRALITGSNNFSYRGVQFGTQEIALYSTDTNLWNDLYQFMQNRIVA